MLETKIDTRKTALLVIDMQNDMVKNNPALAKAAEAKGIIGNIAKVADAARRAGMPVVFVRQIRRKDGADMVPTVTDLMLQGKAPVRGEVLVDGTPGANVIDELKPEAADYVIAKHRPNAFYNTDLELLLRARGIDTVIITGVLTNVCIQGTFQGGRERDMSAVALSDCITCMSPDDDNYFINTFFPRNGRVRTSAELLSVIGKASS